MQQNGVASPEAVFFRISIADVHKFVERVTFPIVAKALSRGLAARWVLAPTSILRTPEQAYAKSIEMRKATASRTSFFQE